MNQLLRAIPKVDDFKQLPEIMALEETYGRVPLLEALRGTFDALRADILGGSVTELPSREALIASVTRKLLLATRPSLHTVLNGTGVILHTNLGRACISQRAAEAVCAVGSRYSNLEYDEEKGSRGLRYTHVESLLQKLTGAEAAMVVNNNAAAVLLMLSALAKDQEVIVSRGELVEIGGSFRIPEIMEQCGCTLKEVGTTNKTHLRDYENAIDENTAALLKVHTSNFRILGFTEDVGFADLSKLGREKGLPVLYDLGSGTLLPLTPFGINGEPTVQDSLREGADLVTFSGDKLLGGPQAGLIVGRRDLIEKLRRHPLNRALRIDKMTLSALEMTLRAYAEETADTELPVRAMIAADPAVLKHKAERLSEQLAALGLSTQVVHCESQVGGGSVPGQTLPSFGVSIAPAPLTATELEKALRTGNTPLIGLIRRDEYLLDVRTLWEEDFDTILDSFARVYGKDRV